MARRNRYGTRSNSHYGLFVMMLIPVALIRFALFAPLGSYREYGREHHRVISDHAELHNGTYGTALMTGESITAKWGTFAFFWNFAVWIPSIWFIPPLNLPFTVIDVVITGYLSTATHYQNGYSPHHKGPCNPDRNPGFHDMLRPDGVNESFFELAARLNATVTSPQAMCESFVKEWQYGIACSFFYALISFFGILAFVGSLHETEQASKTWFELSKATGSVIWACMCGMPRVLAYLVLTLVWALPEAIFRCLPLSVKGPVRQARRSVWKTGLGAEQKVEMKMTVLVTEVKTTRATKGRFQGGEGQNTPLAEFLGIYDMLMLVTQELHYIDIMRLSRVSRSVREAVLPPQDYNRRLDVFKMYTCPGEEKACCWACNSQICTDCRHEPSLSQTPLLWHMDQCLPYCTPCYKSYVVNYLGPTAYRNKIPHCTCAPRTTNPNIFQLFLKSKNYYVHSLASLPKVRRDVCQECGNMRPDKLLELREKKTKTDLMHGRKIDGTRWTTCARLQCGRSLGTGPRWWVHGGACKKECRSAVHRAWGRKENEQSDGVGGSEAV